MENKEQSPDRPFFVDEKELAQVVAVRAFGVPADAGSAAIEVSDQPGASESITVDKAAAPTGAWIAVHLNDDGMPGERVGLAQIPAGESRDVVVQLASDVELTDDLLVAVSRGSRRRWHVRVRHGRQGGQSRSTVLRGR